jgi:low temperature requirement protein LtrA
MGPLLVAPRLRTLQDADAERHATWTELFFDLVPVTTPRAILQATPYIRATSLSASACSR